jgi:hypothetical protein
MLLWAVSVRAAQGSRQFTGREFSLDKRVQCRDIMGCGTSRTSGDTAVTPKQPQKKDDGNAAPKSSSSTTPKPANIAAATYRTLAMIKPDAVKCASLCFDPHTDLPIDTDSGTVLCYSVRL